jgi:pyruvate dehydrogenase E2 component (dihydrolipoamide acetyltransferase)
MGDFRMPLLGADMEAGTLVEWKVRPGDTVTRGQIVAEVETDKGAIEVEIFEDGVVEQLLVPPGCKVPVGTVLATVRGAGETLAPAAAPPPAPRPAVAGAAPGAVEAHRPRVSPLARKRAADLGVDVSTVAGTGAGGAVTVADVEAAAARPAAPARAAVPPMRRAIAAAMSRSKREIPHYYLATDIDASRVVAWLAERNAKAPVTERMLVAAPLLKAVALALREAPELNGVFVDGTFRPADAVHLGVAIALRQGGLVAPAIHDAGRLPVDDLMQALGDLIARVRTGGLRSSELADATVTVTSLGDQGVGTVYGVIFPPQVAMVGLGRVTERAWAAGGEVSARPVLTATLAADHRVSDGLLGARFLAALDRLLQRPEAL